MFSSIGQPTLFSKKTIEPWPSGTEPLVVAVCVAVICEQPGLPHSSKLSWTICDSSPADTSLDR